MLLLKIALRNIFRQRRRSILTGLSMTGGYILCCLSFSLVEGSYGNVIRIFTEDHTGHIQIHKDDYLRRPNVHKSISRLDEVEAALAAEPAVDSFAPRIFSPALAYAHDNNAPVQVVGVDPVREARTTRLEDKVVKGEYPGNRPNANGYFPAMIGRGVADLLEAETGDELILISQGADGSIANDIFIIEAIVGTRDSWDRQHVYLPLVAARQFLSMGNEVHEYALLLNDIDKARTVATRLQETLNFLTVSPWQEVEETFYKTMRSDKKGNQFTLGIVVFIVFIGVLNTVLMSVLERTREFGVLKAIGSRPILISQMILLETTMLALLSIAVGFLVSLPIITWFTYVGFALDQPVDIGGLQFGFLQGELSFYVFMMPTLIILGSAILVSLPPGIRAARVVPRDALASH